MSIYWLYRELENFPNLTIFKSEELIEFNYNGKTYKIYSPDSSEYIITVDVVKKVQSLNGNTISYAKSWCRVSQEAIIYADRHKIIIISHKELFKELT